MERYHQEKPDDHLMQVYGGLTREELQSMLKKLQYSLDLESQNIKLVIGALLAAPGTQGSSHTANAAPAMPAPARSAMPAAAPAMPAAPALPAAAAAALGIFALPAVPKLPDPSTDWQQEYLYVRFLMNTLTEYKSIKGIEDSKIQGINNMLLLWEQSITGLFNPEKQKLQQIRSQLWLVKQHPGNKDIRCRPLSEQDFEKPELKEEYFSAVLEDVNQNFSSYKQTLQDLNSQDQELVQRAQLFINDTQTKINKSLEIINRGLQDLINLIQGYVYSEPSIMQ